VRRGPDLPRCVATKDTTRVLGVFKWPVRRAAQVLRDGVSEGRSLVEFSDKDNRTGSVVG